MFRAFRGSQPFLKPLTVERPSFRSPEPPARTEPICWPQDMLSKTLRRSGLKAHNSDEELEPVMTWYVASKHCPAGKATYAELRKLLNIAWDDRVEEPTENVVGEPRKRNGPARHRFAPERTGKVSVAMAV